ncbi:hypothetical protein IE077_003350 [Cardiosporidium cionae]|uniref:Uncharacterized protein n=1 Tax=Cardiosporidium cionae TaxID=476202 RepID=A0ABQ7J8E6_9APIC|nr:hypothetical protein IE077_003350 [Cardiosporidium cionae]|eukprot:KAF8820268.1 hypothetical protein IE077_003350 [Cardiosporidium cionae]
MNGKNFLFHRHLVLQANGAFLASYHEQDMPHTYTFPVSSLLKASPSMALSGRPRFCTTKRLESWEEVELNRPKVPTLENYQRPPSSPSPNNLPRESFHSFMKGKPQRFSKELKIALTGWFFFLWFVGLNWLTLYLMRPDDFSWVDEERARLENAKRKLAKPLESSEIASANDGSNYTTADL